MSVSGAAAARSSLITRRGSMGTASEAFSCSMKLTHSDLYSSTWSFQGERSRFGPRFSASSISWRSTSRASPTMPSSVG